MSNSNANSIIDGPSTSKCTGQIVSSRPTKNYHQSPLNSDESDVDLSDSDPTYTIDKPIRSEHVRISESSPSSSSSAPSRSSSRASRDNGESVPEVTRRSRKRTRNPSKWKQNVAKRLRNSGKSYVSSITKKEVPARSIKGVCECKLKCSENINDTHRQTLFDRYWSIGNVDLQRSYIRSCMMEIKPKYKYTNAEKPRLPNNAFYFTVNNNRIRVCKTFYINTLGISDRQIRTVKQKTDPHGFVSTDNRGKHTSRKPTDPLLIEQIKQHIESIPRIESHFLRDSTSREYFTDSSEPVSASSENGGTSREFISGEKTITELWRDFVKFQTEKGEPTCEYWLYYDIFNKEFNIGFFQPKKDRCNLCMKYELGTPQYKLSIQKKFEDHMNEKEWCRQEKRLDRQNINETNLCAVYDLQAVLQCPTGDTSAFFYNSKLNCLNFTIVQMLKKADPTRDTNDRTAEQVIGAYDNVHSYFWDELQGKRGANEIGSCIFDYLKRLNDQNPNKQLNVIFYSDNCCGQNKNKYIASLYSYAVTCFENIHTITHKYLIKGHTQNEGDNVHSLIEKEIKRNKKSGPIYTPYQYVTLIKNSRKTGKPFHVMELTFDFFIDFQNLQENWGYNYNEDEHKNILAWNAIKVLKFCKAEQFVIYYKTSYSQNEFTKINIRNKRKKMPGPGEIALKKAFSQKQELGEHKKKDLRDLINHNLIPSYYADFYSSIL
ncbi:uncharacterized protein LOC134805981 [Cydia splendana]|uniref:uncharacterized protein LOC134805981 n=1 Tax=Cydia splendana TaxID=1100963 RepID=UPI00300DBAD1